MGWASASARAFFRVGQRFDRPQAERPDEVGVGDVDFESRFCRNPKQSAFFLPLPNELYAFNCTVQAARL